MIYNTQNKEEDDSLLPQKHPGNAEERKDTTDITPQALTGIKFTYQIMIANVERCPKDINNHMAACI